jgi:2-polyprenyl-3-methyl-5-hydroxy-6-metoxy-1,4-benzoquinol methylase
MINMVSRIEQKEEELWGKERVRRYAEEHKKYAGLMYRGIVKNVRALNLSGRFMEMGAGPGFLAVMMAREHPDITITAVDLSPDMAEVANEYIAENRLAGRITYVVGDVGDRELMENLGKFALVYSTFSLHHWESAEDSIRNLWSAVGDNGVLYIHDFRRLWLMSCLPFKGGAIDSMKAAYSPDEIRAVLRKTGITDYRIRNRFPFLIQSVVARK